MQSAVYAGVRRHEHRVRRTGRLVRFSGYEEWTLSENGLIARSLGHFDAEDYARQLAGGLVRWAA